MYNFINYINYYDYYAYFTPNQTDTHIPYCYNYYRPCYDNTYDLIY